MFQILEHNQDFSSLAIPWQRRLCGLIIAILTLALMGVVINTEVATPIITPLIDEKLPLSGVENPVTAVLLNFRSYDTLLEIAVLMIAVIAMLPVIHSTGKQQWMAVRPQQKIGPVLQRFLSWLIPLTVVTSGYVLWTGAHAPGGAFQAGALLAAAGVLLLLIGDQRFYLSSLVMRGLLIIGLLMFIAVAVAVTAFDGNLLQYPSETAGAWILVIESAATLSIATILLLLFCSVVAASAPTEHLHTHAVKTTPALEQKSITVEQRP